MNKQNIEWKKFIKYPSVEFSGWIKDSMHAPIYCLLRKGDKEVKLIHNELGEDFVSEVHKVAEIIEKEVVLRTDET